MENPKRLEEVNFSSNKEKFLLPSSYMGAKMKKGIFKGLRYFSNIFDPKEPDMQIGYPTNVKHVAHIGWDGPSENTPSWMNGFRSAPLMATVNKDPIETMKFSSSEFVLTGELPRLVPKSSGKTERTEKPSRRKKLFDESTRSSDSPKRESSSSKHSQHRQSRRSGSGDDSAEGSSRSHRESSGGSEAVTGENDPPGIPKQSRRRRAKGSSSNSGGGGGGSTHTRSRYKGKEEGGNQEEIDDFLPPPKSVKGIKEEIIDDFLASERSPLTSL